jgi:cell division septum initiation protein DivIVA
MSAELLVDDGAARPSAPGTAPDAASPDRRRPNVSGDLPTVLSAAPMFRRAVGGYDRFEVDTYVRWAEDELATADHEREHLLTRHLSTCAALEEARQLLGHSPGGGELLRLADRVGSVLAVAADEADSMRAEAEADRRAAAAQAARTAAQAQRLLADAGAEARRLVGDAAARVEEMTAGAARVADEAGRTLHAAREAAEARLEEVRAGERRAAADADRIRQQAAAEAAAARLQARDEVVRMLGAGRDVRRRADDEAAATRERLERDAATRRAALLAEVAALEHRRTALRAEVELPAGPVPAPAGGRAGLRLVERLGRLVDRRGRPSRSMRTP